MQLDRVACLCLDQRKPEWEKLEQEVPKLLGLPLTKFIAGDGTNLDLEYDYIDNPNPTIYSWGYSRCGYVQHHWNAFQCHQRIISKAKADGVSNLLMLEDDIYFLSRFGALWQKYKNHPLLDDYDLLYLGWWCGHEEDEWNVEIEDNYRVHGISQLRKVTHISGLHSVVISHRMFDKILRMKPVNPIDLQLNSIHDRIKSYFITPKMTHIKNIWSFCEGSTIKRKVLT